MTLLFVLNFVCTIALFFCLGYYIRESVLIDRFRVALEQGDVPLKVKNIEGVDEILAHSMFLKEMDDMYLEWIDCLYARMDAMECELAEHRAFVEAMRDMDVVFPIGCCGECDCE